jgi:hypothetical protein
MAAGSAPGSSTSVKRRSPIRKALAGSAGLALLALVAVAGVADANHGPSRAGTDPCNGTNAFDINNVITRDLVSSVAGQNPGSVNPDGSIDRTKITHSLQLSSGHVALQLREDAGAAPYARVTFEFAATDPAFAGNSTNHPAFLTAAEAREDPARDADSDLLVGGTFLINIPTDVVPDGNYVARLRAFDAAGAELGRVCTDAIVSNGQDAQEALRANTDPAYEPAESTAPGYGFTPQPVLWFPAGEPVTAQQAGYGAKELRIEFVESLTDVKVEREETDPVDPLLKVWTDYTALLADDNFTRTHFIAGGRMDGTPLEPQGNEKVWGPGYKLDFSGLGAEALPNERLRVSGTDAAGKSFCGVYTFSAGANGSFAVSRPAAC